MTVFVDRQDTRLTIVFPADEPNHVGLTGGRAGQPLDGDQRGIAGRIENDRAVRVAGGSVSLEADQETVALGEELDHGASLRVSLASELGTLLGDLLLLEKLPAEEGSENGRGSRQEPGRTSQPSDEARGGLPEAKLGAEPTASASGDRLGGGSEGE
jgi:hypothetical protein